MESCCWKILKPFLISTSLILFITDNSFNIIMLLQLKNDKLEFLLIGITIFFLDLLVIYIIEKIKFEKEFFYNLLIENQRPDKYPYWRVVWLIFFYIYLSYCLIITICSIYYSEFVDSLDKKNSNINYILLRNVVSFVYFFSTFIYNAIVFFRDKLINYLIHRRHPNLRNSLVSNDENFSIEQIILNGNDDFQSSLNFNDEKYKISFNELNKYCDNDDKCAICWDFIIKNERDKDNNLMFEVVKLNCNHLFHFNCIKYMIKYSNKCPYCRKIL